MMINHHQPQQQQLQRLPPPHHGQSAVQPPHITQQQQLSMSSCSKTSPMIHQVAAPNPPLNVTQQRHQQYTQQQQMQQQNQLQLHQFTFATLTNLADHLLCQQHLQQKTSGKSVGNDDANDDATKKRRHNTPKQQRAAKRRGRLLILQCLKSALCVAHQLTIPFQAQAHLNLALFLSRTSASSACSSSSPKFGVCRYGTADQMAMTSFHQAASLAMFAHHTFIENHINKDSNNSAMTQQNREMERDLMRAQIECVHHFTEFVSQLEFAYRQLANQREQRRLHHPHQQPISDEELLQLRNQAVSMLQHLCGVLRHSLKSVNGASTAGGVEVTIASSCVANEEQQLRFWMTRVQFKLAQLLADAGQSKRALECLTQQQQQNHHANNSGQSGERASFVRRLFELSRSLLLLRMGHLDDATLISGVTNNKNNDADENDDDDSAAKDNDYAISQQPHQQQSIASLRAHHQSQHLRIFQSVLRISRLIAIGHAKSARNHLKALHATIQSYAADEERLQQLQHLQQQQQQQEATIAQSNNEQQQQNEFHWLPCELLIVLAYVITVQQTMQNGMTRRALRYAHKAIAQLDKLERLRVTQLRHREVLRVFRLSMLEHCVQCNLVSGHKLAAIQDLGRLVRLVYPSHQIAGDCATPSDMSQEVVTQEVPICANHEAQLHTLLGMYAMMMNYMELAESQLLCAMRMLRNNFTAGDDAIQQSRDDRLFAFAALDLCLAYIRQNRMDKCAALLDQLHSEFGCDDVTKSKTDATAAAITSSSGQSSPRLFSRSRVLRAAFHYVRGFEQMCRGEFGASRCSMEAVLLLSSDDDLNRLTASALMTVSQIYRNIEAGDAEPLASSSSMTAAETATDTATAATTSSSAAAGAAAMTSSFKQQDTVQIIKPAMSIANAIPDIGIQLWATALLKDLYQLKENTQEETKWFGWHREYSQQVITDHVEAARHSDNELLSWLSGSPPESVLQKSAEPPCLVAQQAAGGRDSPPMINPFAETVAPAASSCAASVMNFLSSGAAAHSSSNYNMQLATTMQNFSAIQSSTTPANTNNDNDNASALHNIDVVRKSQMRLSPATRSAAPFPGGAPPQPHPNSLPQLAQHLHPAATPPPHPQPQHIASSASSNPSFQHHPPHSLYTSLISYPSQPSQMAAFGGIGVSMAAQHAHTQSSFEHLRAASAHPSHQQQPHPPSIYNGSAAQNLTHFGRQ